MLRRLLLAKFEIDKQLITKIYQMKSDKTYILWNC